MHDTIIYRPYRSHGWFVPFAIAAQILSFAAAGFCIPNIGLFVLFFAMGALAAYLAKVLYDSANIVVFFEQEGLRIAGGRYKNYRYFPWEGFSYVYYIRSFRGHLFVVLSPKELSPKEGKNFVRRGANLSRICIDSVVVIHMDVLQNTAQLKELINRHVV